MILKYNDYPKSSQKVAIFPIFMAAAPFPKRGMKALGFVKIMQYKCTNKVK